MNEDDIVDENFANLSCLGYGNFVLIYMIPFCTHWDGVSIAN